MRNSCPFLAKECKNLNSLPNFVCGIKEQDKKRCIYFPFRERDCFKKCSSYKRFKDIYHERKMISEKTEPANEGFEIPAKTG